MHKPTNQQIVDVLKGSLKYLSPTYKDENGKYEFICWAVSAYAKKHRCEEAAEYIQKIISERISPRPTLLFWLNEVHNIPMNHLKAQNGAVLQKHRRAWIKRLIKEFSE